MNEFIERLLFQDGAFTVCKQYKGLWVCLTRDFERTNSNKRGKAFYFGDVSGMEFYAHDKRSCHKQLKQLLNSAFLKNRAKGMK